MHARTGVFSSQLASSNPIRVKDKGILPLSRAFSNPIVAVAGEPRRPPPPRQPGSRAAPPPPRQYAGTPAAPSAPAAAPTLRRDPPSSDDVYLPRSLIMDKEVITRTSGKRLGYVNQLFVDPARLEVVSVYLRQGVTSIGASNTDHVLISSLRQIGDVVLVHDESALLDPPADETYGYIRMVGTEVQTEDGTSLGKVRDFIFNPDNGQVVTIRYDALGLPSIPQSLLSCYTLGWQDIVAVGPTKTIVRFGAERRAVKENDGWISEYVTALVNAVAGADEDGRLEGSAAGGFGLPGSEEAYRSDPAYAAWYQLHAAEYEKYYGQRLPKPITAEMRGQQQQQQRQRQGAPPPQQQQQGRRRPQAPRQPMALPPPSSTSYTQALQPDQQWQQQEYEIVGGFPPPRQQQQQQQQRQYAGGPPPPASATGRRSNPNTNTRQPPPFAPRQEGIPPQQQQQQQQQPRGPPGSGPPPQRAPTRTEGRGGARPPQPRSSAAPTQSRAIEPDAVISGGYKTPPSSPQAAEFVNPQAPPPSQLPDA